MYPPKHYSYLPAIQKFPAVHRVIFVYEFDTEVMQTWPSEQRAGTDVSSMHLKYSGQASGVSMPAYGQYYPAGHFKQDYPSSVSAG